MIKEEWDTLETFDRTDEPLTAPWVKVLDAFGDATHLRIEATGQWQVLGGGIQPCGPDGHMELSLAPERLLVPTAPAGALIGKIGGSSVGRADAPVFPIGSLCTVAIPDKAIGPLFVAVNGALLRPGAVLAQVRLVIAGARPVTSA
jgi:hypothetical protein